ncbi:hypothetical protein SOVF_001360 [Spinacia oleracea]|nr:hypothetical protein SOVF_001360 [Spinacia oleracea]
MSSLDSLPSAMDFNHLFNAISKMKPQRHHSVIISLSRQLELSGLRPNMHTLGILTNCYCHLGRLDFAFSLLGKRIKLGFDPDIVIFTTLINGIIDDNYNNVGQAVKLLDKIVKLGIQPNVVTYGAVVKGLCRKGNNVGAINFLRRMQSDGVCKPDVVMYTIIIDSLCKENMMSQAVNLLEEMQREGISPNVVTYSALVQGCCNSENGKRP